MKYVQLTGILFLVFTGEVLSAQNVNLPIIRDSVYSDILKEERTFDVVLPAKYDANASEKYDVIYQTDAEWSTRIAANIYEFLSIDFMPPNIVIGIDHSPSGKDNMRGRDFTPTKNPFDNNSGGADNFLAFIKNELVPYVNKKYKSSGVNTYSGSSLGGLFGMYAMLKEPKLFNSWLLADPSFWWDNGLMKKMVPDHINDLKGIPVTLLITGREGDAFQEMGIADMDSILKANAPASLHWQVNKYSGETHNAMIFRTVYDGLKFTYSGYLKDAVEFHPMTGILLKNKPATIFIFSDQIKDMKYTTDGTEPTDSSKAVTRMIIIDGPATLTVKSFGNRERYNKVAKGNFTIGSTFPAFAKMKNAKAGGLHYDYYEGQWDSLPDFKSLKPKISGTTSKDFDLSKLPAQHNFAVVQQGQIEAPAEGYYLFGLDCDGGAKLYIGNKLLIDYDGYHEAGKFRSIVVPLSKGFYPIRIEYFQKSRNPNLTLIYMKPGEQNANPITPDMEYSK